MKKQDVKVGMRVVVTNAVEAMWVKGLTGTVMHICDWIELGFSKKDAAGRGHAGTACGEDVNERWFVKAADLALAKAPGIADDLRLTPQARTILSHLKRRAKGISPMEADGAYGISRLASCIHEIRKVGYGVKTSLKQDDAGHKYARYLWSPTAFTDAATTAGQ